MKLSNLLKDLHLRFAAERLSVGELTEQLSGKAYGVLLFILALPNLIPMPAPGLSLITGAPLALFTLQLALGRESPWLPHFLAKRSMKRKDLRTLCNRAIPYLKRVEKIFMPRMTLLVLPPADRFIAALCFVLSLMIAMPIPFGNALPALAICCFALGLLQADGLFILIGLLVMLSSATTIWLFIKATTLSLAHLFGG